MSLYVENYKTGERNESSKQRGTLYPWIEKLNIMKMPFLSRLIYRFTGT